MLLVILLRCSRLVFQTLLVKVSSASFVVICMTLITPVSSICFRFLFHGQACRSSQLNSNRSTWGATNWHCTVPLRRYVFYGKQQGSNGSETGDRPRLTGVDTKLDPLLLEPNSANRLTSVLEQTMLMPTRCGIINSNYTAGGFRKTRYTDWEGSVFSKRLNTNSTNCNFRKPR